MLEKKLANIKIEKIYLALIIIFGSLFLLIQPGFSAPDEGTHFVRAYSVFHRPTDGDSRTFSRYYRSTPDISATRDGSFFESDYITKGDFRENTYHININRRNIQYLPQAFGLVVGQLVYPSIGVMMLFARIFQLVFYIVISYYAIKKAKFGQYLLAAVALLPITIQQAASLSYDVFFFLAIFCSFSYVTNLWTRKTTLNRKDWLYMAGFAIFLFLAKESAITMLLYFVTLPTSILGKNHLYRFMNRFWNFWDKHKVFAGLGVVFIVFLVIKIGFRNVGGFSTGLQVLFNTFGRSDINPHLDGIITDGMIGTFSFLVFKLPSWLVILHFVFLSFLAFVDNENVQLEKRVPLSSIIIFVANLIGVALIMYTDWTIAVLQKDDISWSEGLQGRYFTPFIVTASPLGAFLGKYVKITIKEQNLKKLFIYMNILTLSYSLVLFILFFYVNDAGRWIIPMFWQNVRNLVTWR